MERIKLKIKELGFHFDHQLNDVNEKLEELDRYISEINDKLTKNIFIDFISAHTKWNICDCCGKIEYSEQLEWLNFNEYFDENYKVQRRIQCLVNAEAVCKECWEDFSHLTFLSLDEIKERLNSSNHLLRPGEINVIGNRPVTIKELLPEGQYGIVNDEKKYSDDDLEFKLVDNALCNLFADVIDKYTDHIDRYDERTTYYSSSF
jgi:hypothetical protein